MSDRVDLRGSLRVYLVADPEQSGGDFLVAVEQAVASGVTAVQMRAKSLHDGPFLALAEAVKRICEPQAVPLFVNDRIDVALAIGADGVHVGIDDLPLEMVRRIAGDRVLVGYSPATDEQLRDAITAGADYVGLGPVFPTGSKDDAGAAIGLESLRRRTVASELPSVAIGGITAESAAEAVAAGADGVAVIGAILRSPDPGASARALRRVVDRAVEERGRHG